MTVVLALLAALFPASIVVAQSPAKGKKTGAVAAIQEIAPRQELKFKDTADSLAISHDGKFLAAAHREIGLFDLASGAAKSKIEVPDDAIWYINELILSADDQKLYGGFASSNTEQLMKGGVAVWDVKTGKRLRDFDVADGELGRRAKLALGPKEDFAVIAWSDYGAQADLAKISLWNTAQPKPLRSLEAGRQIRSLVMTPDVKRVIVSAEGTFSHDSTVGVYSLPDLKVVGSLEPGTTEPYWMAASPDSKAVAVGYQSADNNRTIELWSLPGLKPIKSFSQEPEPKTKMGSPRVNLAFTPDGSLLVTCSQLEEATPWRVRVWNVATGKQHAELTGNTADKGIYSMAVGGGQVAVCELGGTIRVWDIPALKKGAAKPPLKKGEKK